MGTGSKAARHDQAHSACAQSSACVDDHPTVQPSSIDHLRQALVAAPDTPGEVPHQTLLPQSSHCLAAASHVLSATNPPWQYLHQDKPGSLWLPIQAGIPEQSATAKQSVVPCMQPHQ